MITLSPYLFFNGNCEEAFNFYKSVFRTEFKFIGRYKDVPQTDKALFRDTDDKIMHITLPIDGEAILMGSDLSELYADAVSTKNFALHISVDSKDEADRLFRDLSTNGKIKLAMAHTFWGSYYGILTDQFGIDWKITFDTDEA